MNVKPDFSKNANAATTAPAFLSVWNLEAYYGESYIVQHRMVGKYFRPVEYFMN